MLFRNGPNAATITPMKFETCTTAFKHNAVTGTWNLERLSNSGKLRVQELTRFFLPTLQEIVRDEDWQIRFVRITYQANGRQYRDISSGQDYLNRRFDKALRGITQLPGCTRRQLNDLVDWLLQTVPTVEIQSFSSPGWHTGHDGRQVYAAYDPSCDFPEKSVPQSIKRRILRPLSASPQDVVSRWKAIRADHPALHFLLNFRLTGSLKPLLRRAGVLGSQVVNVVPSKGCDEQHFVALLVTGDIEHFPVCDLAGGDVELELAESRCGTAVFIDHSFADDQNRVSQSLKSIIRAVRGDVDEELRQSSVFVISTNAWLTARQINRDCVVILDTDGISLQHTAKDLHAAMSEMDTLMIQRLHGLSQEEIVSLFQEIAKKFRDLLIYIPLHIRETFISFLCVEAFWHCFLGCELSIEERYTSIINLLLCERADADCKDTWVLSR